MRPFKFDLFILQATVTPRQQRLQHFGSNVGLKLLFMLSLPGQTGHFPYPAILDAHLLWRHSCQGDLVIL